MIQPKSDLFIQIDSIVKNKKLLDRDYIEHKWVGKYIILRFLSFLEIDDNYELMEFINSMNVDMKLDKYDEYLFMFKLVPQFRGAKFNYIKASKEKLQKQDEEKINNLAQTLELSKKETKYLIENKYINLKQIEL